MLRFLWILDLDEEKTVAGLDQKVDSLEPSLAVTDIVELANVEIVRELENEIPFSERLHHQIGPSARSTCSS